VSELFCAISANGHIAPAPSVTVRSIQEEKRALHPFAGFDEGEIFCAHQIGHGACDGKK
jgi:hypothetical protein